MSTAPFRGSTAVAFGLVTPMELRGPGFQRLLHDVYVAGEVAPDLAVMSAAAHVATAGRGVLCGFSAAELLGASCAPVGAPAEVHVGYGRQRAQPGLRVHRGLLLPDEVTSVAGLPVTSPVRTAYDLGRRSPIREAVVAVDALGRLHGFDLRELLRTRSAHLGARGSGQLDRVLALADPRAESPMETRVRLAVVAGGLPVPALQHPVGRYRLDLAYPAARLGMEYDGRVHLTAERARLDLERQAHLSAAGWQVLRFPAAEVLRRPWAVAGRVRRQLALFGRRNGLTPAEVLAMIAVRDTSALPWQR